MLTTLCSSARGNTGYVGLIIDFHIDSSIIYLYSFLSLTRRHARSHSLVSLLLLNVQNKHKVEWGETELK